MKLLGGKWIAAVLGLWLLGLGLPVSAAQEPVTLGPGMGSIPLAGHIAVLRDETGKLTIDDVRSSELARKFVATDRDVFARGLIQDVYWYRFRLQVPETFPDRNDWLLTAGIPLLDHVDFYTRRNDGTTATLLTGVKGNIPRGGPPTGFHSLPLALSPGESLEIHVRVETTGRHSVLLGLYSQAGYVDYVASNNRFWGAIFGIWMVMAFYNLLIFTVIRERAYVWYVLFIVAMISTTMLFNGYLHQFAGAHAVNFLERFELAFPLALAFFGTMFGREFMQTGSHAPRAHRLTAILAWLTAIPLVAAPIVGELPAARLTLLVVYANFLALLVVAIYLSIKGVRAARFYLLAWSAFFAALLVWLLGVFAGFPIKWPFYYAPPIALCIVVTLLSLSLADRLASDRRDRERYARLKQYLPQKVADLVVEGSGQQLLDPKRRKVTVLVMDLRGFTPFSETTAPEDVMAVLREFYETMGAIVEKHGGTVEHFAGDSMLVFFNAPLEIPNPEKQAVETALEMRQSFEGLRAKWAKRGHELGLGIGIADGYATIGAIGFSGRSQYAAIGAVTNLAARLCSSAKHGEILTTARVLAEVQDTVESEPVGDQNIKGFSRPIQVIRLTGVKA